MNGEFTGVVEPTREAPRLLHDLVAAKQNPVDELYMAGKSFGKYAEMVARVLPDKHSAQSIREVVQVEADRLLAKGPGSNMDDLRRAVLRRYDAEVKAKLVDPALSDVESYQNMRSMLDGQDNSVRGNLAEYWYRARHAPDATAHVGYEVTRTGGKNKGAKEKRVADMQQGRQIVEVKDVAGTTSGLYIAKTKTLEIVVAPGIEVEQREMLLACVERLNHRLTRPTVGRIDTIAYVFIDRGDAEAHLHELWLRELQCWYMDERGKHRLDADYHPTPIPPAWVRALDAR